MKRMGFVFHDARVNMKRITTFIESLLIHLLFISLHLSLTRILVTVLSGINILYPYIYEANVKTSFEKFISFNVFKGPFCLLESVCNIFVFLLMLCIKLKYDCSDSHRHITEQRDKRALRHKRDVVTRIEKEKFRWLGTYLST